MVNSSILLFSVWCLTTHNSWVVLVSTSWRDAAQFGLIGGWVLFSSILHQVLVTLLFAGEILETCGVMVGCPSKVRFNFL